ncbi:serine/threonine protein kinase, AGC [Agyrium rufum]|nr:serine/threonine protein kinase, AGC [Agyrium rufum]
MAAAAAVHTMLPNKLQQILGSDKSTTDQKRHTSNPHIDDETRQRVKDEEKHFVAQHANSASASASNRGHQGQDQQNDEIDHTQLGDPSPQLALSDFQLLKTIGTGTFARVWLARLANPAEEDRDQVFALKIIRKVDVIRLKQVEHVRNERNTLAAVAGFPFITTLITTFSDRDCLYMVLEYCPGGEVFTYLRRARRFGENVARFFAGEIVLILEYLHESEGIAYRDLKPENILIDAEGHLKLVDFGFAKKIGRTETYTLCGTPEYLAPEVIRNTGHGTAVDWWAFGILLYEFLVGQPPFWHSSPMEIYKMIVDANIRFPSSMNPTAVDLIRSCCAKNPSQRLGNIAGGASRIKSHPFFDGFDWDNLRDRRTSGPFIPRIRHPADSSCFDDYDPPAESGSIYTDDMAKAYEDSFQDF